MTLRGRGQLNPLASGHRICGHGRLCRRHPPVSHSAASYAKVPQSGGGGQSTRVDVIFVNGFVGATGVQRVGDIAPGAEVANSFKYHGKRERNPGEETSPKGWQAAGDTRDALTATRSFAIVFIVGAACADKEVSSKTMENGEAAQ